MDYILDLCASIARTAVKYSRYDECESHAKNVVECVTHAFNGSGGFLVFFHDKFEANEKTKLERKKNRIYDRVADGCMRRIL